MKSLNVLSYLLLFLLLNSATFEAHSCDNTIYMSSHPYSQSVTELSILNPFTATSRKISSSAQYGYDAIGFNHLDGFIYAVSNYQPTGDEPRILRIHPETGIITDLGTLPQLTGKEWIVGTIIEDGSYVIGDFATSSWLRIALSPIPRVVDSGNIPVSLITAWAANPLDNIIYGYQSYTMQLMSFNPSNGEFRSFSKPLLNVGVVPCSTAFHQDGKMFLYCKTSDAGTDKMYDINLAEQSAAEISSGEALGAGDMASCAFKQTPPPPVPPAVELIGNWQHRNECLEIKANRNVTSFLRCAPLVKCKKEHGKLSYDQSGALAIQWDDIKSSSELKLLASEKLEVTSSAPRGKDRSIYTKVNRCRWKLPRIPIPQPKPKPKPAPPNPEVTTL